MRRDETEREYLEALNEEVLAQARDHMLPFVLYTFPDYIVNWHHRLICDKLTKFAKGEIKRLIICMPPRRGKSELASRRLVPFLLGQNPNSEVLFASYAIGLARDMSLDAKRIMDQEEYRELFPETRLAEAGKDMDMRDTQTEWAVAGYKGRYRAQGIGGSFTGRGGNFLIIDDPYKDYEQARSEAYREKLKTWYSRVFRSRRAPGAGILIIMNRWHIDDMVGWLLKESETSRWADDWEILNIPEVKENDKDKQDPREVGEVLWPDRYSKEEYLSDAALDPEGAAALWQQRPTVEGGHIVKSDWITKTHERVNPDDPGDWILSCDLRNSGKGNRSSYAVITVWYRAHAQANIHLVDVARGRWETPETIQKIRMMSSRWPRCHLKLVEDAAEGRPIVKMLQGEIPGLVLVRPEGNKETRFRATVPLWHGGNVHLPEDAMWCNEYIAEICSFPGSPNDDQVDATSLGLRWFLDHPPQIGIPFELVAADQYGTGRAKGWVR